MHTFLVVLLSMAAGAAVTYLVSRVRGRAAAPDARPGVTRVDAHLASMSSQKFTPVESTALRRDVQEVFENKEATRDLQVLDRQLRDIRDLSSADEAIFWRWVEARQTLVPNAWSTEGEERPVFFDMRSWGAIVRWTAEESILQFAGDVAGSPALAAVPVRGASGVYGVLTLTASTGLRLDRDALQSWMPRFASQIGALLQLFELRRDYAQHMRRSEALLDAVKRFQGHRSPETLAQAICDTARDVTSAPVAGLVRWNQVEGHGVVQSISTSTDVEIGFHVTADSLVGRACVEGLPLLLEDARSATADTCELGGLARPIGSLAVVPVKSGDVVVGALLVEGKEPADIGQHEARNVGLLAAVARGPLEVAWEIEEVTRRAKTDPLTGLANRRHFDEQLRRVVTETDRFGGTCSLILADLDHFKAVNDQHGHDAGDEVLRRVAQVLCEGIRAVDLCARYGGEEIVILLPQTSEQGAVELAERLRASLESLAVAHGGQPIRVTASFGLATYPAPVPYGDWLVLAADKALYEAKAAGRNCVKVIQPTHVTPALYKQR